MASFSTLHRRLLGGRRPRGGGRLPHRGRPRPAWPRRALANLWRGCRRWLRSWTLPATLGLAACSGTTPVEAPRPSLTMDRHGIMPDLKRARTYVHHLLRDAARQTAASRTSGAKDRPAHPYRCEEFHVELRDDGRSVFRRHRRPWGPARQARFRRLLAMVAREMGADPRLLQIWALRESSYRPDAIHVLNPDLTASVRAWERHRPSPAREAHLRALMARSGAKRRDYWEARAELTRIQTFKDNPYYDDRVDYEVRLPSGDRMRESRSRWAYGYGPFGFNPAYFLPVWDADAPPWVFCDAGGIVAAVTAVWAARRAAAECRALDFGDSYEVVNRRFSGGRCAPRPRLDARFRERARRLGLDPGARARLGRRWRRQGTDRDEIVATLAGRARALGLLPPQAQAMAPTAP